MTSNEINIAFKTVEIKNRNGWEQTRVIAYNVIAPHLKNQPAIQKFMPFTWDNEGFKQKHKVTTKEDLIRIKSFYDKIKTENNNG